MKIVKCYSFKNQVIFNKFKSSNFLFHYLASTLWWTLSHLQSPYISSQAAKSNPCVSHVRFPGWSNLTQYRVASSLPPRAAAPLAAGRPRSALSRLVSWPVYSEPGVLGRARSLWHELQGEELLAGAAGEWIKVVLGSGAQLPADQWWVEPMGLCDTGWGDGACKPGFRIGGLILEVACRTTIVKSDNN